MAWCDTTARLQTNIPELDQGEFEGVSQGHGWTRNGLAQGKLDILYLMHLCVNMKIIQ